MRSFLRAVMAIGLLGLAQCGGEPPASQDPQLTGAPAASAATATADLCGGTCASNQRCCFNACVGQHFCTSLPRCPIFECPPPDVAAQPAPEAAAAPAAPEVALTCGGTTCGPNDNRCCTNCTGARFCYSGTRCPIYECPAP